jgi:hypothetical protein
MGGLGHQLSYAGLLGLALAKLHIGNLCKPGCFLLLKTPSSDGKPQLLGGQLLRGPLLQILQLPVFCLVALTVPASSLQIKLKCLLEKKVVTVSHFRLAIQQIGGLWEIGASGAEKRAQACCSGVAKLGKR